MSTFTLYDATLGTLALEVENGIMVEEFEPGSPEVRGVVYERPGSHGISDESRLFGKRTISISGKIRATPSITRDAALQTLQAYLLPNKRPLLRWTRDGITREISVRVDKMEQKVLMATDDFHISWVAEPFWRALSPTTYTIPFSTTTETSGAEFPWFDGTGSSNLVFSTSETVTAEISVINNGVVEVYPSVVIYGDANSPTLTNITADKTITLGYDMAEADTVELDHYEHTAVLNGETNVFSYLDFDESSWWALQPGTNKIMLTADSIYLSAEPPFAVVSYTELFM